MKPTLQAACIQMCSGNDLESNLNKAGSLLKEAASLGAELALLPENFAFMGAEDTEKRACAEDEKHSPSLAFLSQQAQEHQMWIIGGSITLKSLKYDDKLRNVCPIFSPDGKCISMYDKIHLFDVELKGESYQESDLIISGSTPIMVDCHDWKVGLSICYDLRFPELYRIYAQQHCHILTIPAAFTATTGKVHWETLLKARAIENQCYVLAAGQCGEHPGQRKTWGHSMMIDPWGKIMSTIDNDEGIITAALDQHVLLQIRQSLPSLQHRKM